MPSLQFSPETQNAFLSALVAAYNDRVGDGSNNELTNAKKEPGKGLKQLRDLITTVKTNINKSAEDVAAQDDEEDDDTYQTRITKLKTNAIVKACLATVGRMGDHKLARQCLLYLVQAAQCETIEQLRGLLSAVEVQLIPATHDNQNPNRQIGEGSDENACRAYANALKSKKQTRWYDAAQYAVALTKFHSALGINNANNGYNTAKANHSASKKLMQTFKALTGKLPTETIENGNVVLLNPRDIGDDSEHGVKKTESLDNGENHTSEKKTTVELPVGLSCFKNAIIAQKLQVYDYVPAQVAPVQQQPEPQPPQPNIEGDDDDDHVSDEQKEEAPVVNIDPPAPQAQVIQQAKYKDDPRNAGRLCHYKDLNRQKPDGSLKHHLAHGLLYEGLIYKVQDHFVGYINDKHGNTSAKEAITTAKLALEKKQFNNLTDLVNYLHNDLIPTIKNCGFSKKDIQGKSGDLYKYLNTLVDAYRPLIAPFKKEHMEKPKVLNKLSAPQVSLFGGTAAIKHSIAQAWNKLSDDAKEALPKEVQTLLGDNGLGFMTSDELSSESLTGLQKSVKYVLKKDKVLKAWNSLNKDGQNTNHLKQTKKLTQQPVKFLQKPGINTQLLKNMLALIRATLQNENYQGDEYKGSLKTGGLVNH